MIAGFTSTNSYDPNGLVVGERPTVSRQITLASGQNQLRGAVLGKITSGGKYMLSASASSDGSQTPDCVLAEDCDASGGDKLTVAYFVADLSELKVILGTGHTLASIREGLRQKGLNLLNVQVMY